MKIKRLHLKTKDYSVTGEEFQLLYNDDLEMLETFPRPSLDKLPDYYKSDDYISHTDNQSNLIEKVYHLVRWVSIRKKLRLANSFKSGGKNLLDVGCGTGDFLKIAHKNGWEIMGIEPNDKARQIANKKTNKHVYGAEEFQKIKNDGFDAITLWHVFEHLFNPEEQLSIFKSLLKDNGSIIIAVPNFKSYDSNYYKNFWAAYDVPRHLWHFSKASMRNLTEKSGLKIVATLPMRFDAFYISLLSEKYKNGTMNPLRAFRVGWLSNFKARKSREYSSLIYVIKKREN